MRRRSFLHQLLVVGCGGATMSATGCGSILYSERIHRPHSRDIDWKVAALNGLGLALFFVPGVIAFIVDFHTGAIYLPPHGSDGYAHNDSAEQADSGMLVSDSSDMPREDWQCETIAPESLMLEEIERVVSDRMGTPLSLADSGARVSKLSRWNAFREQVRCHVRDPRFGMTPHSFLREVQTG